MKGVRRFIAAFSLWFAFCAPASAAQFTFAVFGDMPYNAAEEPELTAMIGEMNRDTLAFAMHVGDFKSPESECSDALFAQRHQSFELSDHAFVFIPGDNEWIDCERSTTAPRDPLERLAKLRGVFFARDSTLGRRPLPVERQTTRGYPEHLRWTIQHVLFATLNVPGPDNNRGRMPDESRQRTVAVIDWIQEAFAIARERKLQGIVLALQANIWTRNRAYAEILATLAREALRYNGEVLVVHGDTHWYRFDRPLADARSGRKVENVARLEVFGSPFVDWVRVTADLENGRARFIPVTGRQAAASPFPGGSER